MKNILLIIAIIFITGCAGCTSPEYGEAYTVYIHPDFGDKTELVLVAMNKWNQAVGVELAPIIGVPLHCDDPGNICMYIANEDDLNSRAGHVDPDGEWTGVTHRDDKDYSSVYILDVMLAAINSPDPDMHNRAMDATIKTIPHELGHAFGLQHDPHKGAVMCKDTGCGSSEITCWDKQQYFNLRGMDYYCN